MPKGIAGLATSIDNPDLNRPAWSRVWTIARRHEMEEALDGRMQQRLTDEVRRVSCPELSHRLGAMAFESPWADTHPQGALLVGVPLADEVQNLALAPRQGFLAGA